MPVTFWHTIVSFWFFLSYIITTVLGCIDHWILKHWYQITYLGTCVIIITLINYFLSNYRDNNATFSIVEGRDIRFNRNNMGTEKYRLKWSKFESNILNAFQSLYETEQLSDVTLFCEGKYFLFNQKNVHKY